MKPRQRDRRVAMRAVGEGWRRRSSAGMNDRNATRITRGRLVPGTELSEANLYLAEFNPNRPLSVFANRDSTPLVLISRRIAAYSVA